MSMWTYLQGSIKVSVPTHTFYTQDHLKEFVEWAIYDIQKTTNITGSERNVDISVHPLDRNGFIGDGPYSRDTFQDATLSMSGSFRDREFPRTFNETIEFIHKLKDYLEITRVCIDVYNDMGDSHKHITNVKEGADTTFVDLEQLQDIDDDELFRTRHKHMEDFKKFFCCSKERMIALIDTLNLLSFKAFEDVMDSDPLCRKIDWDYGLTYLENLVKRGLELPKLKPENLEAIKKHVQENT